MGILAYIFSNVKINIVSENNSYYLIISNEDYEYQFNCYSGKLDDEKKVVGNSESVKKLNIKGDDDKGKLTDGAASPTAFNNVTVSDQDKNSGSLEQPEQDQTDSENDPDTPVFNDEDSYLSDTTIYSTSSEIDDIDSEKSESHSNSQETSRISRPSLLKVSSNGIFQVYKCSASASASFSKVEVTTTTNEISKVTWRTLGCQHENQEISPLSCDNEKSLQFCHHCLQELIPM